MGAYVFDNAWEKERERLSAIERYYDPGTIRVIESLGITPGWSCLEVGGGGGSIAAWMSRRVGGHGRVVATDLDTRFLETITEPNVQVLRHDVTVDELPESEFDLIHARLLLEHLPNRDVVLKRLAAALRPGGWIVVEDLDWGLLKARPPLVFVHPPSTTRSSVRVARQMAAAMERAGYDAEYGRRLPAELLGCGLVDIGAEGRDRLLTGGSPETIVAQWTLERLRPAMVASNKVTNRDIDRELARIADPASLWRGLFIIAAWGRRLGVAEPRTARQRPVPEESVVDRLRLVPLFAACTGAELEKIASLLREKTVQAGHLLTREGAPGSSFFIIATGTATVTRKGTRLAQLGPGSFFGEVALLTQGLRTATVEADGPMKLFELDDQSFHALMSNAPTVAQKVMRGLAERLQQADETITESDETEYPPYA